jgi:hypothetical protein
LRRTGAAQRGRTRRPFNRTSCGLDRSYRARNAAADRARYAVDGTDGSILAGDDMQNSIDGAFDHRQSPRVALSPCAATAPLVGAPGKTTGSRSTYSGSRRIIRQTSKKVAGRSSEKEQTDGRPAERRAASSERIAASRPAAIGGQPRAQVFFSAHDSAPAPRGRLRDSAPRRSTTSRRRHPLDPQRRCSPAKFAPTRSALGSGVKN